MLKQAHNLKRICGCDVAIFVTFADAAGAQAVPDVLVQGALELRLLTCVQVHQRAPCFVGLMTPTHTALWPRLSRQLRLHLQRVRAKCPSLTIVSAETLERARASASSLLKTLASSGLVCSVLWTLTG
jgi:hypothetical protein